MITDNLSGYKGTTQSSAIIWRSLDSSISQSGTSQHCPIVNPLVSLPHQWYPITLGYLSPPFLCLQHQSPRLIKFLFKLSYIIDVYLLLLLLLLLLCRIVTLFCIVLYCNLVEYCNILCCDTLCKLYCNLVNVRSNE